jgi:hypothetical protein
VKNASQYASTLKRLRDQMGAEVLFIQPGHVLLPMHERAKMRMLTDEMFTGSASFPGALSSECAFVWDWAYGPEQWHEDVFLKWKGKVATQLKRMLNYAGFDIDRCTYISLSRDPQPPTGTPSIDHSGLRYALQAADTQFIVLIGSAALKAFHPDVSLEQVAGKSATWNLGEVGGSWVMPTYHPSAAWRGLVDADEIRQHLCEFRQHMDDDDFWPGSRCVAKKCGEDIYARGIGGMLDERGYPWCDKHLGEIRKSLTRVSPKGVIRGQGSLL